jgi:hypothetical protein
MSTGGWLRRNRWGLIALLPVLAATIGLSWGDAYDTYWKSQPREPVKAGSDGWVSFAGARIRLADLSAGTDLTDFGGDKFVPPSGTAVWKARLMFDAARTDGLRGCLIKLQDAGGRTYEARPPELSGSRARSTGCTPSLEDEGKTRYEAVAYFVTPSWARPAGVRITMALQYPRYVLLQL